MVCSYELILNRHFCLVNYCIYKCYRKVIVRNKPLPLYPVIIAWSVSSCAPRLLVVWLFQKFVQNSADIRLVFDRCKAAYWIGLHSSQIRPGHVRHKLDELTRTNIRKQRFGISPVLYYGQLLYERTMTRYSDICPSKVG